MEDLLNGSLEETRERNRERFRASADPAERKAVLHDGIERIDRQIGTLRSKIGRLQSMISDAEVTSILRSAGSLDEAAEDLVRAANQSGGKDNITVILFRLGEGEPVAQPTAVRPVPSDEDTIAGERNITAKVTCPADVEQKKGVKFTCTAKVKGEADTPFEVTVTDDAGAVDFVAK